MKRKASAYTKAILALAVIFVGFPVLVYVLFSATDRAWDMTGAAVSPLKESSPGAAGGDSFFKAIFSIGGGEREAKRVEREVRKTAAWVTVAGACMAAFVLISAASMLFSFRKKPGKKTAKRKHRRRRYVRVRV